MLRAVNRVRAHHGLDKLQGSRRLRRLARRHSRRMARAGGIFHQTNLTELVPKGSWNYLGENVAVVPDLRTAMRAFMNSDPHRRNILFPQYRRLGVGAVEKNGAVFVTQIFSG